MTLCGPRSGSMNHHAPGLPWYSVSMCGAMSRYFAGKRSRQRFKGSLTCESASSSRVCGIDDSFCLQRVLSLLVQLINETFLHQPIDDRVVGEGFDGQAFFAHRSEEHTSELQSRVDISYAVF